MFFEILLAIFCIKITGMRNKTSIDFGSNYSVVSLITGGCKPL